MNMNQSDFKGIRDFIFLVAFCMAVVVCAALIFFENEAGQSFQDGNVYDATTTFNPTEIQGVAPSIGQSLSRAEMNETDAPNLVKVVCATPEHGEVSNASIKYSIGTKIGEEDELAQFAVPDHGIQLDIGDRVFITAEWISIEGKDYSGLIQCTYSGEKEISLLMEYRPSGIFGVIATNDAPFTKLKVWLSDHRRLSKDITDAQGRFGFPNLAEGNYLIWVGESRMAPLLSFEISLQRGETRMLVLEVPTGALEIRVYTNREDNQNWTGPVLLAPFPGNGTSSIVGGSFKETDQDGRVLFEGLEPGEYAIEIGVKGFLIPPGFSERYSPLTQIVRVGTDKEIVEVELMKPSFLSLMVNNSSGSQVAFYEAILWSNGVPCSGQKGFFSGHQEEGERYTFAVPPGTIDILINGRSEGHGTARVEVNEGDVIEVNILLEESSIIVYSDPLTLAGKDLATLEFFSKGALLRRIDFKKASSRSTNLNLAGGSNRESLNSPRMRKEIVLPFGGDYFIRAKFGSGETKVFQRTLLHQDLIEISD